MLFLPGKLGAWMTLAKFRERGRLGILVVAATALAGTVSVFAFGPPVSLDGMQKLSQTIAEGVTIIQYREQSTASPYDSDFDVRTVAVLFGRDVGALCEFTGISSQCLGDGARPPLLLEPPYADQIVRRHRSEKVRRHRSWTISRERIRYGTQGFAAGYTIDCAIGYSALHYGTIAVFECFSLENWQRFLKTLDLMEQTVGGESFT